METLKQDLFNDSQLDIQKNRVAGMPCASSIAGNGTFCCTGGAGCPDKVFDLGF